MIVHKAEDTAVDLHCKCWETAPCRKHWDPIDCVTAGCPCCTEEKKDGSTA